MSISPKTIKIGRDPELGWYVKGGNVTVWCLSFAEALNHCQLGLKKN